MSDYSLTPRLVKPSAFDLARSIDLAELIGAHKDQPFQNCLMATLKMPRLTYVEGCIVKEDCGYSIIGSCWLEDTSGRVVDPTPGGLATQQDSVTCVPAVRWNAASIRRLIAFHDFTLVGPLSRYLPGGALESREWRDARLSAYRHVRARTSELDRDATPDPEADARILEELIGPYWFEQHRAPNGALARAVRLLGL